MLSRNQSTALCFHLLAMIQTCTHPYSNKYSPRWVQSKKSIGKCLIGNRFHVKLCILIPENCKQILRVKSWKAKVTAEKKNSRLQSNYHNTSSEITQLNKLTDIKNTSCDKKKLWLISFNPSKFQPIKILNLNLDAWNILTQLFLYLTSASN